ncbi:PilN domain-containing protein [Rhodocyclaceae bacterium SMB388]
MVAETRDARAMAHPAHGWAQFRRGWSDALQWPVFAWLNASEPVRVVHADGRIGVHDGASGATLSSARVRTTAVLVPDPIVLRAERVLPALDPDDLAAAIALQAAELSPFDEADTVHGWQARMRADGRLDVIIAIASRAHVSAHLAALAARAADDPRAPGLALASEAEPEVWAGGNPSIVLRGFGEPARLARQARHRRTLLAMLMIAASLSIALAATPVLVQSQRLAHARSALQALQSETRAILGERESLVRTNDKLNALARVFEDDVDLPVLLETLTRTLPDQAYLQRLEVSGRQVRIAGFSDNAAQLIDRLGEQPGFVEVRTPSPISRGRDGRESFSVEFTLNGAPIDRID